MTVDWPTVFAGTKTVLDPLAIASWPIALAIVIYSFRKPIESLLNRIKQVTGFGGTAEFTPVLPARDQMSESPEATAVAITSDPSKMPPSDPVFDVFDTQLTATLESQMPGDMHLQRAWAIRHRSISEAYRLHEAHYRAIFGSQIQALKALNTLDKGPVRDLEVHYKTAADNPTWALF